MPWPDDYIFYSINVEDIRNVAEEDGLRILTGQEIKQAGDKIGGYIELYGAVRMAIADVAPDSVSKLKEEGQKHDC